MPVQWMADLGFPTIFIYLFLVWRTLRVIHQMPPSTIRVLCQALAVFVLLTAAKGGGAGYAPWTWIMLGVATSIAFMETQASLSAARDAGIGAAGVPPRVQ